MHVGYASLFQNPFDALSDREVWQEEVRMALAGAEGPRARLEAIVRAGFGPSNFRPEAVSAWLNFWTMARQSPGAARLLRIYEGRLRSNLLANLRPLVGARAPAAAERIAALIDGVYLRQGIRTGEPDPAQAVHLVLSALANETGETPQ